MNNRDLQSRRNRVITLIRPMNRHRDCLKWGTGETDEHIQRKLDICKYLKKRGQQFYTEAIFDNGLRADIVSVDQALIYEIVNSENEISILKKKTDYPLPIIFVDARKEWNEKMIQ